MLQGFWHEQLKDGIAICKDGEDGKSAGLWGDDQT